MEKVIQEITNYLEIPRKRKKAELNRVDITKCNVSMSNMATDDRRIAMYANDLEQIQFLLKENNPANLDEIKRIRAELANLEKCKGVREYKAVLEYRSMLEAQISDYYRIINVDLRKELLDMTLPDIFVSQGTCVGRHVIEAGTYLYSPELADYDTLIIPNQMDLTSARNARHFYNQVSFKYLEQLTQDFSYDPEEKDLGNVRILRRGQ